ncbi:DUF4291 domain-containing protein [Fulvivirgaceae bacterium BMA12]|uniref:DUF4291 domain-containing protein n=1 Tax=Agaribacillus aureus TaxID=3051825 RepID=A0ABT8L2K1_9BACT|nr:DUF4291 domain-containing protein [Fulvivirgaceae bacterium BMA12]
MNIITEKYHEAVDRLPSSGKHIIAHQTENSLVVYQAFKPSIALFAVKNQKFGGSDYNFNRMTWIKPNFLWMMYRSGWASKVGQERILAITISKSSFNEILNGAVVSSYDPEYFPNREEWEKEIKNSDVRLQWDPDHDPFGDKIERRAIQLGLRGNSQKKFNDEQIEKIEDITDFVVSQGQLVIANKLNKLEVPYEAVYLPTDEKLIEKIKIDKIERPIE